MAKILELIFENKISPDNLISWLDGDNTLGVLEDLQHLRVEFVPVFLNFLREQSSSLVSFALPSGLTPSKAPSGVRAVKYVSPGKDQNSRNRPRRQPLAAKAKTLQFDTPVKVKPSKANEDSLNESPDLEQLLHGSDSSHSRGLLISPPSGVNPIDTFSFTTPISQSSQRHRKNVTSTPNQMYGTSPKSASPQERQQRGRKLNMEGDHASRRGYNSEVKHSEQRLSLGDFMTTDIKRGKKKSPLPRDSGGTKTSYTGRMMRHQEMKSTLDITDQDAFPMVGSVPSQDKQQKRRINPTRVTSSTQSSNKSFSSASKAVFGIPQSQSPSSPFITSEEGSGMSMEDERELLRQERLKRQESVTSGDSGRGSGNHSISESSGVATVNKYSEKTSDYIKPSPSLVTNSSCLDILVHIYSELLLYNMAPNIMVELYFLIQLLTVQIITSADPHRTEQCENFLSSIHNCVYFATNVFVTSTPLIKLLDRGTIRLLSENPRIQEFSASLTKQLSEFLESPPPVQLLDQTPKSPIGSVSFQSETDNRNNFPSDQAFHVFRKQRDMFYEMLRIWEQNHLTPGWSYGQSLGSRIRQLFSLRAESTNFAHFARLFQSQLLTMCRGDDDQSFSQQEADGLGFLTQLKKQHPEKYMRLYERLVTPSKLGGPCPPPSFPGSQEFFRDFIVTGSNLSFNQHLKDALIRHILELNDREFYIVEPEEGETDPVDSMVRIESRSVILNLRLLAKFLGFVEFLPYQTSEHLPENVMATQIMLRSKVHPPINLNAVLRQSALSGKLVVGVTWVVEYLSMVDPVALHSRHYLTLIMSLIAIFKILYIVRPKKRSGCPVCDTTSSASKSLSPSNSLLLKLLLGWLFDLPNFPDGLFFADVNDSDIDRSEYSQTVEVLSANYNYMCVKCLRLLLLPSRRNSKQLENSLTLQLQNCSINGKSTEHRGLHETPTKTPSKQKIERTLLSPIKTPSKFLAVSILESPQITPQKTAVSETVVESALYLDISSFVDQQMITICCPFVGELKNLLSDFWLGLGSSRTTNSYRKITTLSVCDKSSPAQSQKQLQLQLEDNFFHNNPSSVRMTTDFVAERTSSNVIKNIRTKIIPRLKEKALEQLKLTVDSLVQHPGQAVDRVRGLVQKRVVDLSQEMTQQMKAQCNEEAIHCSQEQLLPTLSLLLPPDMSTKGAEMCVKVVSRNSQEKVSSWIQSNLTPTLFSKDLSADAERLLRQAQKAIDFQMISQQTSFNDTTLSNLETSADTSLTSGTDNYSYTGNQSSLSIPEFSVYSPVNQVRMPLPTVPRKTTSSRETLPVIASQHCQDANPPSKTLKLIMDVERCIVTSVDIKNADTEEEVAKLIKTVRFTITGRQDMTLPAFRAMEALTVNLAIAITACAPKVMTADIQSAFISIWRPVAEGGVIPVPGGLKSLLDTRTIMMIGQNPVLSHQEAAWKRLEELIIGLLSAELLSPASLQEQCISLLRQSWPQEILSGLSTCIMSITRSGLKHKSLSKDTSLLQLLEWVGWVCGHVDDFPDCL